MPLNVTALNLYSAYPVEDAYHTGNTGGIIRYIDVRDSITLPAIQRLQGDIMHRFILVEKTINGLIEFLNANPLVAGLDDSIYLRVDGTRDFTQPVSGVDPTQGNHLSTRDYVDDSFNAVHAGAAAVSQSLAEYKSVTPYTFQSAWSEYTWHGGQKTTVDITVPALTGVGYPDYDRLVGIRILEKLDIAQPTSSVPNPPAVYVYRDRTAGNKAFAIDDYWAIPASNLVRVLIPNFSGFDIYPGSGYEDLQSPRRRWLKVVITAPKA